VSTQRLLTLPYALLLTLAPLVAACPPGPVAEPGDASAEVSGDASDTPAWQVCIPGEVSACVVEGSTRAMICNASGTAYVEGECTGELGQTTPCVDGACMPCVAGEQACDGDFMVIRCNAESTAFEPHLDCRDSRGKVCRAPGTCQTLCELNFKNQSSIGCDYWAADLDNAFVPGGANGYYDAMNAQYALVVAVPPNSPLSAVIEIYQFEGGSEQKVPFDSQGVPLPTEPLEPGDVRVYHLGPRNVNGTVIAPLAYRVVSSAPIMAYQFNPLNDEGVFSNDASLLLPATLVGGEYYVMTREQTHDTLRSYLTVIPTFLGGTTTVAVDFSFSTQAGLINPGAPDEGTISRYDAGDSAVFKLEPYQVLNIQTDGPGGDPTGSRIRANRNVVVFGGSEAANAPNEAACINVSTVTGTGHCKGNAEISCATMEDCVDAGVISCCADHLEQQLLPVSNWGTRYIAAKSWERGVESDVWRVMAARDNTVVRLVPPIPGLNVPVLDAGEWFEFETAGHLEIISDDVDKPLLVGQFLPTQQATGKSAAERGGDPAFILSVPVEQFRSDTAFLVPNDFFGAYINVIAESEASVSLDGEPFEPELAEPIGSGTHVVYRLPVAPGAHAVTAQGGNVAVMVYGYDKHVSFGYTAGMKLEPLRKPKLLDD